MSEKPAPISLSVYGYLRAEKMRRRAERRAMLTAFYYGCAGGLVAGYIIGGVVFQILSAAIK